MLVTLTKLSSVENVGLFGLAMAISTPIIVFTNLHLRTVYVTDVKDDYNFGEYLGLRLFTIAFAFILVLFIGLCRGSDLYTTAILVTWCMAQCVVSLKDSFLAVMQKNERMDKVSQSRVMQAVGSLVVFTGLLFLTRNLLIAAIGVLFVRIIVLLFWDIVNAKYIFSYLNQSSESKLSLIPSFNLNRIYKLMIMTFPLGIVMGLVSLSKNIPCYFIESYHGKELLGYFTPIVSFVVVGNMMIIAIAQSVAPRLAVYYNENIQAFGKLLIKLFFIGLFVGIAGIIVAQLFGEFILSKFFKPEYSQYKNILVLIMVAATPYYITSFLNNGLMAARKFKIQVPLMVFSIIIVLIISYLLIPKYGQIGAAWAMFAGAMVTMVGTMVLNYFEYRNKISKS